MRIEYIRISNFKSIDTLEIKDIENALILVGQNNTGKSTVIDAIRAVCGDYKIQFADFDDSGANIEISIRLRIFDSDLVNLQKMGLVSRCRRYEPWLREFGERLPSYVPDGEEFDEPDGGVLSFTFYANRTGKVRWDDGFHKNNQWISTIFPKIYYMDAERDLTVFSRDMLFLQENEEMKCMKAGCCIFEHAKKCNHCFSCIGLINRKTVEELTAFETSKLLEYKTYQMNLDEFSAKVNRIYRRNGGQDTIVYSMNNDLESMLTVNTEIHTDAGGFTRPVSYMGRGMRSIYMLSLLEADLDDSNYPCIIMMEEPEMSLHPTLQKKSGDILYRLSKKHQVIFTTHSPNLLPNFNSRQIRQMVCDREGRSVVKEKTDISVILSDLGYTANDLMNVNFVFIVEGKQDKSRLPILLKKYYSEMYDEDGNLSRVAIITTNSCTNIKTYANLKYMNQVYIRDQFLMIRDGDGKNPKELRKQLCRYYEEQDLRDVDHLPRVTEKNVLILKYYSFENYFLNPAIMAKLGVIKSESDFYKIFLQKWKEYLNRIRSGIHLKQIMGHDLQSIQDVKDNMELIKRYMRGHNVFDIFYGRYKNSETELLTKYVELAPREDFADILNSIDRFIIFESRKK